MKTDKVSVRLPGGWKEELARIGKPDDRDVSSLTRLALKDKYPTLQKVSQRKTKEVIREEA